VFSPSYRHPPHLHSFPTRRSSDLTCRNLLITMTLGGLWHGAAWTFVFWGILHAVFLIVHRGFQDFCGRRPVLTRWLQTPPGTTRSEEHTSELQSRFDLVCRLLLEK